MTSDLRARLARLGYRDGVDTPSRPPTGVEIEPSEEDPSVGLFPAFRRRQVTHPIDAVLSGCRVPTPQGDCFVADHAHGAGHLHGAWRLDEALEVDPALLPLLGRDPELGTLKLGDCAFLDTETTGLAGGTGTYAFLVGVAYFDGTSFRVRQFFMEDYDGEEALLHAVAETLIPFKGVVSFNGKAFDLPLLETRFLMSRRAFPLRGAPHLDLLFPARRLWKERLESCALSNLEREILGVDRDGDVPGWAIPGIYFNYLQTGDARPLGPVFYHNHLDLLSLATLAARLARQYADPFHPEFEDHRDLHSLGIVFEGLGHTDRAALCYERAMVLASPGEARGRTMVRLGNLYKRLRHRQDALALWQKLATSSRTYTLVAHVELAKHYEHVERDYLEAERVTLQAMATLELRAGRGETWHLQEERRQLEHRLARLRRKMAK